MQPRWHGPTDSISYLEHTGLMAHVQRGFESDSDRWGWAIAMGAMVEFVRWYGERSLFAFSTTELVADTHNDISFNPRGAMWEEGLVYAVHENEHLDWQAGLVYRCRHDIDNADPEQYSGIGTQRTLIYGSLTGKLFFHEDRLSGWEMPLDLWIRADAYTFKEDYRIPFALGGVGTDFTRLAWTLGFGFQVEPWRTENSGLYLAASADLSAFGAESGFVSRFARVQQATYDGRAEAGYEIEGRAGRLQLFAGVESWQDYGQTPLPRDTRYFMVGFRFTAVDFSRF